jgi:hypothetical protein
MHLTAIQRKYGRWCHEKGLPPLAAQIGIALAELFESAPLSA